MGVVVSLGRKGTAVGLEVDHVVAGGKVSDCVGAVRRSVGGLDA